MRDKSLLCLICAVSLFAFGCGDDSSSGTGGSGGTGTCEFESTFAAIQQTIFEDKGCTQSTCHGAPAQDAAGGLDLREGQSYASLVRAVGGAAPIDRVFPGDQLRSLLYLKLEAKTNGTDLAAQGISGNPMPQLGDALTADELDIIADWIRGGADETDIVAGTEEKLNCDGPLPPADPNKIDPLPAPVEGVGVQLYSGAWELPAESEDEVCFVTHYDFSAIVPEAAKVPCPAEWGEGRECFAYGRAELAQDPQSHHSLPSVYLPKSDPLGGDWGDDWTCLGGENNGSACDPTNIGGCGARSRCSTRVTTAVACIGYGPSPDDFSDFSLSALAGNSASRFRILTGQESTFVDEPLQGVYNVLPVDGLVAWNSHAFNLTSKDTTIEQWLNMEFVNANEREYQRVEIFDVSKIFAMGVLEPFTEREVCSTLTLPQYTNLTSISSHMHQRGKRFRIWLPPNEPCRGGFTGADPSCTPPAGEADYESLLYDDPLYTYYDPPLVYGSDSDADRTLKACALYDNGATNPLEVKRESTKPDANTCAFVNQVGGLLGLSDSGCGCPPEKRACLGGDNQGAACNGDDGVCGDGGVCDACPLSGGITTDDEMFVVFGNYHLVLPEI